MTTLTNPPVLATSTLPSKLASGKYLGGLSDLEDAIPMLRDTVDCIPDDHPPTPTYLGNLGSPSRIRFEHLGELSDLEDAISTLRDVVDLIPDGHPGKSDCLHNIGLSFMTRFGRLEDPSGLEISIPMLRAAVDLTPRDHHPSRQPQHFSLYSIRVLRRAARPRRCDFNAKKCC